MEVKIDLSASTSDLVSEVQVEALKIATAVATETVVPTDYACEATTRNASPRAETSDSIADEWRLLYSLQYAFDEMLECACWQKAQAALVLQRYQRALASPLVKAALGVRISFFGIPLTISGNAMLWSQLRSPSVLPGCPPELAAAMQQAAWWSSAALTLVLVLAYAVKAFYCRMAVILEAISHKRNTFLFAPLLVMVVMDLSAPFEAPARATQVALFWLPFALQTIGAVVVYRQWLFDGNRSLADTSPSFLMGTVGWFFCCTLGFRSRLPGFAWFCFSVGMLFYALVLILTIRVLPAVAREEDTRWSIFMNLAPPSIASSAISAAARLGGPVLDPSGQLLALFVAAQLFFVYIALFIAVLLVLELGLRHFPRRYQMDLWATAFPTVALAVALLQASQLPPSGAVGPQAALHTMLIPEWIAAVATAAALLLTLGLLLWLLLSLWRTRSCPWHPDPLLHQMQARLQQRCQEECKCCQCAAELGLPVPGA